MGDNCIKVLSAATTNNMTGCKRKNTTGLKISSDEISSKMKSDDSDNAGGKKLTQARLPFKPLDQKSAKHVTASVRKRKLSEQDPSASKGPKLQKVTVENKVKSNVSYDSIDMDVCDEVISSSVSGNTSVSSLRTLKTHTLDKFFSPKNVQDEIISSSTSDYVDLTKSEGEDVIDYKLEENVEKENKVAENFNEDANFTSPVDSKVKTDKNANIKQLINHKILKEKYDLSLSSQHKLKSEVKIILQDVAFCDISGCSTPKSLKKHLANSTFFLKNSKSIDLSSPVKQDESSSDPDDSICVTPDRQESSSTTPASCHSAGGVSETDDKSSEVTTPKGTQVKPKRSKRDEARQKIKDEREQEQLKRKQEKETERLQKLQQRKEEKEKKDQERQQQKLQKDKERQEKKDILDKERLEKEKQKEDQRRKKQEIIDAKQEEKRKKDEERKIKEEEKTKEEEEKLRKQARTKAAFQNFFVQKPKNCQTGKSREHSGMFMPFEVKKNMRMAPSCRRFLSKENVEDLDGKMETQDHESLYLLELKTRVLAPKKSAKTWPKEEESEGDIYHISHEEDVVNKVTYRVKLLQFHTNHRPPYYGTWRKSSKSLSPKNPWKVDSVLFDYEIDSDDEWEEEEPGESLSSSEGEEEKEEKEEDDEEEDGWMVPHGYLSEDEGCEEDDEVSPEMLKARQAAKAELWENQIKVQCLPHKAEYIGCVWEGCSNDIILTGILSEYKLCVLDGEIPITTSHNGVPKDLESTENRKRRIVPEEAIPDLIKFIHGSRTGIRKLVIEFQSYWNVKHAGSVAKTSQGESKAESNVDNTPGTPSNKTDSSKQNVTPNTSVNELDAPEETFIISKRQLDKKITAIAMRKKQTDYSKICWYVHKEILKQYGLEDLPLKDKVSEMKAQEDILTGTSAPSNKNPQPNPPNAESKTLNNKNEKSNKTLSRDQMSILSFAQAADKISSAKMETDSETVENKSDDLKSPSSKPLPRDQMSILSFTIAATEKIAAEKVGVDNNCDDVIIVEPQKPHEEKQVAKQKCDIKPESQVKTASAGVESSGSHRGTEPSSSPEIAVNSINPELVLTEEPKSTTEKTDP